MFSKKTWSEIKEPITTSHNPVDYCSWDIMQWVLWRKFTEEYSVDDDDEDDDDDDADDDDDDDDDDAESLRCVDVDLSVSQDSFTSKKDICSFSG